MSQLLSCPAGCTLQWFLAVVAIALLRFLLSRLDVTSSPRCNSDKDHKWQGLITEKPVGEPSAAALRGQHRSESHGASQKGVFDKGDSSPQGTAFLQSQASCRKCSLTPVCERGLQVSID